MTNYFQELSGDKLPKINNFGHFCQSFLMVAIDKIFRQNLLEQQYHTSINKKLSISYNP